MVGVKVRKGAEKVKLRKVKKTNEHLSILFLCGHCDLRHHSVVKARTTRWLKRGGMTELADTKIQNEILWKNIPIRSPQIMGVVSTSCSPMGSANVQNST